MHSLDKHEKNAKTATEKHNIISCLLTLSQPKSVPKISDVCHPYTHTNLPSPHFSGTPWVSNPLMFSDSCKMLTRLNMNPNTLLCL